ncbi:MAG: IMPACT family protein [Clostridia bacterium]|nr:IMPACT family protein [Clostridia bacterium]
MNYYTIDGEYRTEFEIKHSRFICSMKEINSFEDGLEYVKKISKEFSDATHNCYACIGLNGNQKFSDDGEPDKTAGLPILNVLRGRNLENVVCVVTRYFGGIKLGTGGLVAAYSDSVKKCLDVAKFKTMVDCNIYKLNISYSNLSGMNKLIAEFGKILDTVYDLEISIKFAIPIEFESKFVEELNEQFNGDIILGNPLEKAKINLLK